MGGTYSTAKLKLRSLFNVSVKGMRTSMTVRSPTRAPVWFLRDSRAWVREGAKRDIRLSYDPDVLAATFW